LRINHFAPVWFHQEIWNQSYDHLFQLRYQKPEGLHSMTTNDKKPDPWTRKADNGSNSTTIAIIVAALVLVVGAFIFFGSTTTTPDGQQLTQNNMPPAPITEPATPPANVPATPPADAPAANS